MTVWDVVGPLVVILAVLGAGWTVWRLTPDRRRNAELAAKAALAEAEAHRWEALVQATATPAHELPPARPRPGMDRECEKCGHPRRDHQAGLCWHRDTPGVDCQCECAGFRP